MFLRSKYRSLCFLAVFSAFGFISHLVQAQGFETPSTPGTVLYFISPANGDSLQSPIRVQFGLRGMGVAPAGTEKEGTGHHHLLIDVPLPPFDENIIADENHIHFGGGQTETVIELVPGTHTLQLLLGDQNHLPHVPPVFSEKITITVVE